MSKKINPNHTYFFIWPNNGFQSTNVNNKNGSFNIYFEKFYVYYFPTNQIKFLKQLYNMFLG